MCISIYVQVAAVIPLVGIVMVGVTTARTGRWMDAFRPAPDWGPGDPDEQDEYAQHLLEKRRCKQHPYGPPGHPMQGYPNYGYYGDNLAMQYPAGYYPTYPGGGGGSYHM